MNLDHRRHVVRLEGGEIDRRTGRGAGGEGPRGGAGGGSERRETQLFLPWMVESVRLEKARRRGC